MKLYNIKENDEQVSFGQAVRQGLGRNQGLFFPSELPKFDDVDALLAEDFVTRSAKILSALIGDELPAEKVNELVDNAFQFPAPINQVKDSVYALELFHGPTLAFKDFGGRFMAQSLAQSLMVARSLSLQRHLAIRVRRLLTRFTAWKTSMLLSFIQKARSARYKKSYSAH